MTRFAPPQMTRQKATVALKVHLAQCDTDRLFALTVEDLAPAYKLSRREIAIVLEASRDSRRRLEREGL